MIPLKTKSKSYSAVDNASILSKSRSSNAFPTVTHFSSIVLNDIYPTKDTHNSPVREDVLNLFQLPDIVANQARRIPEFTSLSSFHDIVKDIYYLSNFSDYSTMLNSTNHVTTSPAFPSPAYAPINSTRHFLYPCSEGITARVIMLDNRFLDKFGKLFEDKNTPKDTNNTINNADAYIELLKSSYAGLHSSRNTNQRQQIRCTLISTDGCNLYSIEFNEIKDYWSMIAAIKKAVSKHSVYCAGSCEYISRAVHSKAKDKATSGMGLEILTNGLISAVGQSRTSSKDTDQHRFEIQDATLKIYDPQYASPTAINLAHPATATIQPNQEINLPLEDISTALNHNLNQQWLYSGNLKSPGSSSILFSNKVCIETIDLRSIRAIAITVDYDVPKPLLLEVSIEVPVDSQVTAPTSDLNQLDPFETPKDLPLAVGVSHLSLRPPSDVRLQLKSTYDITEISKESLSEKDLQNKLEIQSLVENVNYSASYTHDHTITNQPWDGPVTSCATTLLIPLSESDFLPNAINIPPQSSPPPSLARKIFEASPQNSIEIINSEYYTTSPYYEEDSMLKRHYSTHAIPAKLEIRVISTEDSLLNHSKDTPPTASKDSIGRHLIPLSALIQTIGGSRINSANLSAPRSSLIINNKRSSGNLKISRNSSGKPPSITNTTTVFKCHVSDVGIKDRDLLSFHSNSFSSSKNATPIRNEFIEPQVSSIRRSTSTGAKSINSNPESIENHDQQGFFIKKVKLNSMSMYPIKMKQKSALRALQLKVKAATDLPSIKSTNPPSVYCIIHAVNSQGTRVNISLMNANKGVTEIRTETIKSFNPQWNAEFFIHDEQFGTENIANIIITVKDASSGFLKHTVIGSASLPITCFLHNLEAEFCLPLELTTKARANVFREKSTEIQMGTQLVDVVIASEANSSSQLGEGSSSNKPKYIIKPANKRQSKHGNEAMYQANNDSDYQIAYMKYSLHPTEFGNTWWPFQSLLSRIGGKAMLNQTNTSLVDSHSGSSSGYLFAGWDSLRIRLNPGSSGPLYSCKEIDLKSLTVTLSYDKLLDVQELTPSTMQITVYILFLTSNPIQVSKGDVRYAPGIVSLLVAPCPAFEFHSIMFQRMTTSFNRQKLVAVSTSVRELKTISVKGDLTIANSNESSSQLSRTSSLMSSQLSATTSPSAPSMSFVHSNSIATINKQQQARIRQMATELIDEVRQISLLIERQIIEYSQYLMSHFNGFLSLNEGSYFPIASTCTDLHFAVDTGNSWIERLANPSHGSAIFSSILTAPDHILNTHQDSQFISNNPAPTPTIITNIKHEVLDSIIRNKLYFAYLRYICKDLPMILSDFDDLIPEFSLFGIRRMVDADCREQKLFMKFSTSDLSVVTDAIDESEEFEEKEILNTKVSSDRQILIEKFNKMLAISTGRIRDYILFSGGHYNNYLMNNYFNYSLETTGKSCIENVIESYYKAFKKFFDPLISSKEIFQKLSGQDMKSGLIRLLVDHNEDYNVQVQSLLSIAFNMFAAPPLILTEDIDRVLEWYGKSLLLDVKKWLANSLRQASSNRTNKFNLPWDVEAISEGGQWISFLPESIRYQLNIFSEICCINTTSSSSDISARKSLYLSINDTVVEAEGYSLLLLSDEYIRALQSRHWDQGDRSSGELRENLRFLLAIINDCHRLSTVHLQPLLSIATTSNLNVLVVQALADSFSSIADLAIRNVVRVIFMDLQQIMIEFETQWSCDPKNNLARSISATLKYHFQEIRNEVNPLGYMSILCGCAEVIVLRFLYFLRERVGINVVNKNGMPHISHHHGAVGAVSLGLNMAVSGITNTAGTVLNVAASGVNSISGGKEKDNTHGTLQMKGKLSKEDVVRLVHDIETIKRCFLGQRMLTSNLKTNDASTKKDTFHDESNHCDYLNICLKSYLSYLDDIAILLSTEYDSIEFLRHISGVSHLLHVTENIIHEAKSRLPNATIHVNGSKEGTDPPNPTVSMAKVFLLNCICLLRPDASPELTSFVKITIDDQRLKALNCLSEIQYSFSAYRNNESDVPINANESPYVESYLQYFSQKEDIEATASKQSNSPHVIVRDYHMTPPPYYWIQDDNRRCLARGVNYSLFITQLPISTATVRNSIGISIIQAFNRMELQVGEGTTSGHHIRCSARTVEMYSKIFPVLHKHSNGNISNANTSTLNPSASISKNISIGSNLNEESNVIRSQMSNNITPFPDRSRNPSLNSVSSAVSTGMEPTTPSLNTMGRSFLSPMSEATNKLINPSHLKFNKTLKAFREKATDMSILSNMDAISHIILGGGVVGTVSGTTGNKKKNEEFVLNLMRIIGLEDPEPEPIATGSTETSEPIVKISKGSSFHHGDRINGAGFERSDSNKVSKDDNDDQSDRSSVTNNIIPRSNIPSERFNSMLTTTTAMTPSRSKRLEMMDMIQIEISSIQVRGLQSLSLLGTSNPYIAISVGNQRQKTEVIWNSKNHTAEWKNAKLYFQINRDDIDKQKLLINVFDKERIRRKRFMGTVAVKLTSVDLLSSCASWYALEGGSNSSNAEIFFVMTILE